MSDSTANVPLYRSPVQQVNNDELSAKLNGQEVSFIYIYDGETGTNNIVSRNMDFSLYRDTCRLIPQMSIGYN
jgi:hypothetical protein